MESFRKPKKVNDRFYKYWLSQKQCVFCGGEGSPSHHLPNPENGKRRSRDDLQIPTCLKCHTHIGRHPLEEKAKLDNLYRMAGKFWDEYQADKIKKWGGK